MTVIERGAIHTMQAKGPYTGKPRPALILQNTDIPFDSVVILLMTTTFRDAPSFRVAIAPGAGNRLGETTYVMCEKIVTIPKANLGASLGLVDDEAMKRIEAAVLTVLGFPV